MASNQACIGNFDVAARIINYLGPTRCDRMTSRMKHTSSCMINAVSESAPRIAAIVVGFLSTALALLLIWSQLRAGGDWLGIIFGSSAATLAMICWGFALRGHIAESRRRTISALVGGVVLGGIGFAAGFFGPIILTPQSNQGPLIGIFVTGPLGFVLGAVVGWLYARIRASQQKSS